MTLEDVRQKLGLKTPEQWFLNHVLPRFSDPGVLESTHAAELCSIGTGKTTEMLLRATHYVMEHPQELVFLVAYSMARARSLQDQMQGWLRDLGREKLCTNVFASMYPDPHHNNFVDHDWNLVQEPR